MTKLIKLLGVFIILSVAVLSSDLISLGQGDFTDKVDKGNGMTEDVFNSSRYETYLDSSSNVNISQVIEIHEISSSRKLEENYLVEAINVSREGK